MPEEENLLFRAIEEYDSRLTECSDDALILDDAIYFVRVAKTRKLCENILALASHNNLTPGRVLRLIARNVGAGEGKKGLRDELLEVFPLTQTALDFLISRFADPETKK